MTHHDSCETCLRIVRALARLAYAIGYTETGDEMTELLEEVNTGGGEPVRCVICGRLPAEECSAAVHQAHRVQWDEFLDGNEEEESE